MQSIRVWDLVARVTHWMVAALVIGELTIIGEDWALHRWAGYAVLGSGPIKVVPMECEI